MDLINVIFYTNSSSINKKNLTPNIKISSNELDSVLPGSDELKLEREYKHVKFSLEPFFNELLNSITSVFNNKKNRTFIICKQNQRPVTFNDLIKALFNDANPFKRNINLNVKQFLGQLTGPFHNIQSNLDDKQKDLLKEFFSKGAFNEFRAKLALFYLKSAGVIKDFIQSQCASKLDHEKIDFLILKQGKNPQASDEFCALQVKSSDFKLNEFRGSDQQNHRETSLSGIMAVNAGEKSLPVIANAIEIELSKPNTKSLPVNKLDQDCSKWLDQIIQHFSAKPQSA
jgi:hypothetical protein